MGVPMRTCLEKVRIEVYPAGIRIYRHCRFIQAEGSGGINVNVNFLGVCVEDWTDDALPEILFCL
jgi:hypothetical protein